MALTLYLDQNYLSGMAKQKPAFADLEPVLRDAVARGALVVVESHVHEAESAPRPDLGLLELLRELSGGRCLPDAADAGAGSARRARATLERTIAAEFPERYPRASDAADLDAMTLALEHCDLVTCDAFMADVIRRSRLDVWHHCEVFSGRRRDVERLRGRVLAGTT